MTNLDFFFSSLDKRHCINKKRKKNSEPTKHSNSDKDIFVLNIRFSAIMSVLQISCSLIVSRKKKKNKFESNVQQTLCISLHFFPLLVWYEDERTVSVSFFFLRIELFPLYKYHIRGWHDSVPVFLSIIN